MLFSVAEKIIFSVDFSVCPRVYYITTIENQSKSMEQLKASSHPVKGRRHLMVNIHTCALIVSVN